MGDISVLKPAIYLINDVQLSEAMSLVMSCITGQGRDHCNNESQLCYPSLWQLISFCISILISNFVDHFRRRDATQTGHAQFSYDDVSFWYDCID